MKSFGVNWTAPTGSCNADSIFLHSTGRRCAAYAFGWIVDETMRCVSNCTACSTEPIKNVGREAIGSGTRFARAKTGCWFASFDNRQRNDERCQQCYGDQQHSRLVRQTRQRRTNVATNGVGAVAIEREPTARTRKSAVALWPKKLASLRNACDTAITATTPTLIAFNSGVHR